jgi:hypothetical protein
MSIFASRTQRTIEIPFDPPHTVTIQKLAGRHLEKARQEQQFASFDFVKRIGGMAAFRQELGAVTNADRQVEAAKSDPFQRFARSVILEKGVVSWSYDEPVSAERLDDLDDSAADWLARQILDLTLPNGDGEKKTST